MKVRMNIPPFVQFVFAKSGEIEVSVLDESGKVIVQAMLNKTPLPLPNDASRLLVDEKDSPGVRFLRLKEQQ